MSVLKKIIGVLKEPRLAGQASLSLVFRGTGQALVLIMYVVAARALSVDDYGTFVFLFALMNITVVAVKLGFDTTILRVFGADPDMGEDSRRLFQFSTRVVITLLPIAVLVLAWGSSTMLVGSPAFLTAMLSTALVAILALSSLRASLLMGLRDVAWSILPDALLRPSVMILAILAAMSLNIELSATHAIGFYLLGALIVLIIYQWRVGNRLGATVVPRPNRTEAVGWLRVSVPVLLTSASLQLLNQTDIILVGGILGPEDAGLYGAASKISLVVLLGLNAIQTVAAPRIAAAHAAGNLRVGQLVLDRIVLLSFCFASIVGVGLVFGGPFVLSIFGEEYSRATFVLSILVLGSVVSATAGANGFVMTMTGHQDVAFVILSAVVVLNIGLNFAFISWMGMEGAALATLISGIVWNVSLCVAGARIVGLRSWLSPRVFVGIGKRSSSR